MIALHAQDALSSYNGNDRDHLVQNSAVESREMINATYQARHALPYGHAQNRQVLRYRQGGHAMAGQYEWLASSVA